LSNLPFILKVRFFFSSSHMKMLLFGLQHIVTTFIYFMFWFNVYSCYHCGTSNMHSVWAENIVCSCLIMSFLSLIS
jgi:hypothetical protein